MTAVLLFAVIAALALLAGGVAVGVPLGMRRQRAITAASGPVCGCGHSLSLHDEKSRTCVASVRRPHYDRWGDRNGHEYVNCPCRRYVGPEPFNELWIPPTHSIE